MLKTLGLVGLNRMGQILQLDHMSTKNNLLVDKVSDKESTIWWNIMGEVFCVHALQVQFSDDPKEEAVIQWCALSRKCARYQHNEELLVDELARPWKGKDQLRERRLNGARSRRSLTTWRVKPESFWLGVFISWGRLFSKRQKRSNNRISHGGSIGKFSDSVRRVCNLSSGTGVNHICQYCLTLVCKLEKKNLFTNELSSGATALNSRIRRRNSEGVLLPRCSSCSNGRYLLSDDQEFPCRTSIFRES